MTDNPLIITCAVTGAELTKKEHPRLPVTPEEIVQAAVEAAKAGAAIIHLHVRDDAGRPTQHPEVFARVTEGIRKQSDCIIQYSTGGAAGTPIARRIAPLHIRPDMATLSLGTLNFGRDIFENSEATIHAIYNEIRKFHIYPEMEIFDMGMMDTLNRLCRKTIVTPPFHVNVVMGVPGGIQGDIKRLLMLTDALPPHVTWTVSGIGRCQLPLTCHAIAMGGHVRVGFEDNIYFRKGEPALSNAQFVERAARLAGEMNRSVATPGEARKILGLPHPVSRIAKKENPS